MRDLLIASLVTWRISSLIAREDGPFWVFGNFRYYVSEKAKTGKKAWMTLSDGIECVWCNSIWFAIIFALFVDGNYFLNIFAISAMAIFIDSILGWLNG